MGEGGSPRWEQMRTRGSLIDSENVHKYMSKLFKPNLYASVCHPDKNQTWLFVYSGKFKGWLHFWMHICVKSWRKWIWLVWAALHFWFISWYESFRIWTWWPTRNAQQEILIFPLHTKSHVWFISGWRPNAYRLSFKPILKAVPKPLLIEFSVRHRLESCGICLTSCTLLIKENLHTMLWPHLYFIRDPDCQIRPDMTDRRGLAYKLLVRDLNKCGVAKKSVSWLHLFESVTICHQFKVVGAIWKMIFRVV